MSIPKIGVDPISPTLFIGISERELLKHPKLGLNQVQPRSLGGRPCRMDMQVLEQSEEPGMVVDVVQVVEDHVQALPRVAFTQLAERLADFGDATTRAKNAVQVI